MHWFIASLGSAFVFGLAGMLMKMSQMNGGARSSLLLGLYATGTLGFWVQALLAGTWEPFELRVWLWGAIVGLGSAWGNLLFMKALEFGPASLTSPLTNGNIVFVVAMGALWFGEAVRPLSLLGVIALLAAAALLAVKTGGARSPIRPGWYPLVAGATLLFVFRNGGLKVTDSLGLDNTNVLWAGYSLSWLWFAVMGLLERSRNSIGRQDGKAAAYVDRDAAGASGGSDGARPEDRSLTGANKARLARSVGWRWGLAAGVCSYGGLQLYAAALASGPSHLVAPIFATNSLVVVLGSFLLYRERLTRLQGLALILLLLGLILVRT